MTEIANQNSEIKNSPTTRLAPSPTGALHLGNARTFLVNWAMARQRRWRIVMRIDDLDGPRVKSGADAQALDDLAWLGLDWDGAPTRQRDDLAPYHAALDALAAAGRTFRCTCTRSDLRRAQSAPHQNDHELRYPGTCRSRGMQEAPGEETSVRVIVPGSPVVFEDEFQGSQSVPVQDEVGDFVVATKARLPAYQLAVVVDDARQHVTHIVRGDDLIRSTGRQIALMRMLGVASLPQYWHLPLVYGPDGRRLAKRHGDTRVATYRDLGVPPDAIVGLMASWSGVLKERAALGAATFLDRFDIGRLPHEPITFTAEDHRWLLEQI
ncbi:MAG: tRNA glutamyl-Q(34) synthetase GluQRS [Phycisphaeraceae bacterium]|nr:tRNA glutamyl-Q(34) synthetase GluQRS [Phycisphaeraceae bacterium]